MNGKDKRLLNHEASATITSRQAKFLHRPLYSRFPSPHTLLSASTLLSVTLFFMTVLFAPGSAYSTTTSYAYENNTIHITLENDAFEITPQDPFTEVTLEGYDTHYSPGDPMLPHKVFRIALPPDADLTTVAVYFTVLEESEIATPCLVAPGPPNAFWDGTAPTYSWGENKQIQDGYNMNVYGKDAFFPQACTMDLLPSQIRKWKIAQFDFFPVVYNPTRQTLKVIDKAEVTVVYATEVSAKAAMDLVLMDDTMDDVASDLLENFAEATPWYEYAGTKSLPDSQFSYVIMTTNAILENSRSLRVFEDFKERQGFSVLTVTEDTQYSVLNEKGLGEGWGGGTGSAAADNLRQWLMNNYAALGINYVLLIGDPHPEQGAVPMKKCWPRNGATKDSEYQDAPTDYYYAELTGDWDMDKDGRAGEFDNDFGAGGLDSGVEVYVGRIPVYNNDYNALDHILQKTIKYGQESGTLDWRNRVLLPMKPLDDVQTFAYFLGEGIHRDVVVPSGWNSYRIYENNYGCNPEKTPCTQESVATEWRKGYGMVTWFTHGSETHAADIFHINLCPTLDDSRPSFVFQCSCNNGMPEIPNNLGFSLLHKGAVGTVSSSRGSWYVPGNENWNYKGSNSALAYSYTAKLVGKNYTAKALYDSKMDSLPSSKSEWWMNCLEFNLYGDPALKIDDAAGNIAPPSTEMIPVPRLAGLPVAEAKPTLKGCDLVPGNVTYSVTNEVPEGNIIASTPSEGTLVAQFTSVDLVVATKVPRNDKVQVPRVTGLSLEDAKSSIARSGLKVGNFRYDYDDTIPADHIVWVNPSEGTMVAPATSLTLCVSLGPQGGCGCQYSLDSKSIPGDWLLVGVSLMSMAGLKRFKIL